MARVYALNALRYEKQDISSFELRVYADALFASNFDLLFQLGLIVLLCYRSNRCHVSDFSSKKSKLIVRSIIKGDVGAFSNAFDASFVFARDLITTFQQQILINMFPDTRQIFKVVERESALQKNGL